MSTLVLCSCTTAHRQHDFTAGLWGLCSVCSHPVGVHKSTDKRNAEVAEQVGRLLRTYEIESWSVATSTGGLHLELDLKAAS